MALEQDIANLVHASNDLTKIVDNKIQKIDQRIAAKEQEVDHFLKDAQTGPFFIARGNCEWWYLPPGVWTELTGANINWSLTKQEDNVFNTTTGRFTAPTEGLYHFFAQTYAYNDNNAADGYIYWQLAVDGDVGWNDGYTPYNMFGYGTVAHYMDGISTAATIYLKKDQTVSLKPYKGSGTANSRIFGYYTYFSGFMVGR